MMNNAACCRCGETNEHACIMCGRYMCASTYHFIDIEHERRITICVATYQIGAHQLFATSSDSQLALQKNRRLS